MRLRAVVDGERAGQPIEVVVGVVDGAVAFEVPSVSRSASVQFSVDHAQLDGALDTLSAQASAEPEPMPSRQDEAEEVRR